MQPRDPGPGPAQRDGAGLAGGVDGAQEHVGHLGAQLRSRERPACVRVLDALQAAPHAVVVRRYGPLCLLEAHTVV